MADSDPNAEDAPASAADDPSHAKGDQPQRTPAELLATPLVVEKMEGAVELKVPLVADSGTGATWYECKSGG